MPPAAPRRPEKVTMACLFIGLASLLWLYQIGSVLSAWTSLQVQQALAEATEQAAQYGGVGAQTLIEAVRILLMIAAAFAVTGVILAFYAARGHQASRVILTVVAAITALGFAVSSPWGVIPGAFALVSIVYLWSREARAWYALKNGRELPAQLAGIAPSGPARHAEPSPPPAGPRVHVPDDPGGGGTPPAPASSVQVMAPAGSPARTPVPPPGPTGRPRRLVIAVVVTAIASGLVAGLAGCWALLGFLAPGPMASTIEDHPMEMIRQMPAQYGTDAVTLIRIMAIAMALFAGLALIGLVLAGLAFLGSNAARYALIAMSGLTAVLGVLTIPVGLLWTGLAVWVIVLLLHPSTRAWYAARRAR